MAKPSDFVETEVIPDGMPRYLDIPAAPKPCPICDGPVGKTVVTTRIPVLMPDGMWSHIFRPAHPYCAFMYEQAL